MRMSRVSSQRPHIVKKDSDGFETLYTKVYQMLVSTVLAREKEKVSMGTRKHREHLLYDLYIWTPTSTTATCS